MSQAHLNFTKAVKMLQEWIDESSKDGPEADILKQLKIDMQKVCENAYLAAKSVQDIPRAVELIKKATELATELQGERSKEALNNYYQLAQS